MKWLEPSPIDVPAELAVAVGGHPLVAQTLVSRGIHSPEAALAFLDPAHYRPMSPLELPDMGLAVERLQAAVDAGEGILVWGDFDVDGLTATALLVEALRELGADPLWYIPDRRSESHGVHWNSLQRFLGRGVRVLLTCDTGISAHQEVALARKAGLDVLITDHHDVPPRIPSAHAVVNPKRLPREHALRHLSGVGVAYQLAEALGAGDRGVDLVALGLVADVVPMRGAVRYLVQRGLRLLRRTERVGLQALLEVAETDANTLDEDHISYLLAPRLNALGRLSDASVAVELFITQDVVRARTIAAQMEVLNVRRQFLSRQVTAAAESQLARDPALTSGSVLVLSHAEWPGSVLGIAASRLAERYYKPVILIATPPGEPARGSARSVPGVDIHAALAAQRDLLTRFGGHPMAAGFSMAGEHIPELRRALARTVAETVGDLPPERELPIESYLSLSQLKLDLADELARLAPFGVDNLPPYLATMRLRVVGSRTIGRTAEHRRLEVQDEEGHSAEVLWWQGADLPLPEGLFDLAYVLRVSEFRGERRLQLEWVDGRWAEEPAVDLLAPVVAVAVADYRLLPSPLPVLQALWDADTMQIWGEAVSLTGLPAFGRSQLQHGRALVVWTAPPSPRIWQEVLQHVRPGQVYLFAVDPQLDRLDTFLRRLGGLVKHAVGTRSGRLEWVELAAAMAHRVQTVRAGVRWLAAKGHVSLVAEEDVTAILEGGGVADPEEERTVRRQLQDLLSETAAYRRYYREAESGMLFAA